MSIIQTSCSELLVDTAIHDPKEAFERFTELFKALEWETSPPLTVELLEAIKNMPEEEQQDIVVYDSEGNRATLEYGDNGYITTLGYRFDSHCNDWDVLCYPIFYEVINKLNGELISCDGGVTNGYKDWEASER